MPLSYIITSPILNPYFDKVWEMKQHFSRFENITKTNPNSVISLNEAHITLKHRFYLLDDAKEKDLIAALLRISFKPIPIQTNAVSLFESETLNNVIVARVIKHPALLTLRENIMHAVMPFITPETYTEKHEYNPHISLVYDLPTAQIEEAKQYAKNEVLPIKYQMSSFQLLKNIPGISKEREVVQAIQA